MTDLRLGDCQDILKQMPSESIDCVITSPPYDNLREYNGKLNWNFAIFQSVADELYRVMKDGAVMVWIVGDETINGSESLTSFRQALYFKEIGFSVETMIWEKPTFTATGALKYRYGQVFEYMFILVKGSKPKTFNPIKDRLCVSYGRSKTGTIRQRDGTTRCISSKGKECRKFGQRFNVWRMSAEMSNKKRCHPAQFPEQLVYDHIISWTNEGDIVLDPFMGSGTTGVVCIKTNRNFKGIEINGNYFNLSKERTNKAQEET